MAVAHDYQQCAGDMRFAAPEQVYPLGYQIAPDQRFRFYQAGDLYNLGSLIHYLLVGTSVTQEITARLKEEHRPPNAGGGWTDRVDLIYPYWNSELASLLTELSDLADSESEKGYTAEVGFLISMISELCQPDWQRRGDPRFLGAPNQFNLARYITKLDLFCTRIAVLSKKNAA